MVGIAEVHLSILKCITSALKCHPGSPRSAKSLSSRIAVQNLWKPSQSRPIRVPLSNSQRALQRNAEKKYYEGINVAIHNAYSCASYNLCCIIYLLLIVVVYISIYFFKCLPPELLFGSQPAGESQTFHSRWAQNLEGTNKNKTC